MKKLLITILLLTFTQLVFADVNKKYSYKDFSDKSLKNVDVKELNNSEIYGSCFYQQENPDADIFPDGMTGVHFVTGNNLDNVYVPAGNIIGEGNTHKKLKTQKDKCTWILNDDKTPKEPLSKKKFIELGISILPKDIPTEKVSENILQKKEREMKEQEKLDVEEFKTKRKEELKTKTDSSVTQEVKKVKGD